MLLTAQNVVEVVERYDDKCSIGKSCDIKLDIDDDMEKPIYVYYELRNFYQSHRHYVRSRKDKQLRGEDLSGWEVSGVVGCAPVQTYEDLFDKDYYTKPTASWLAKGQYSSLADFEADNSDDIAFP